MTRRMVRGHREPAHRHPRPLHRPAPGRTRPSAVDLRRRGGLRAPARAPAPRSRSTPDRSASTRPSTCSPWPSRSGCVVVVDTDAHAPGQLEWQRHGCEQAARRGRPGRADHEHPAHGGVPGLDGGHGAERDRPFAPPEYHEPVTLPVSPPVAPMLAKLVRELPEAEGLFYEPKWDGFRCIVFRDGDEVVLGSRNEKPLTRYFPELVEAAASQPARPVRARRRDRHRRPVRPRLRCAARSGSIRPQSRVDAAGRDHPGLVRRLRPPGPRRRRSPGRAASPTGAGRWRSALATPRPRSTSPRSPTDPDVARDWFSRFEGAGLDGVVVKAGDLAYQPDKRVMLKVKHERTADCVVGGLPVAQVRRRGRLAAARALRRRGRAPPRRRGLRFQRRPAGGVRRGARALPERRRLGAPVADRSDAATGGVPGGQSRWSAGKDLSWEPLRPELVAEVAYDHLQGDRFRHATSFRRWRTDREPDVVHLRPAGHPGAQRARRGLR